MGGYILGTQTQMENFHVQHSGAAVAHNNKDDKKT